MENTCAIRGELLYLRTGCYIFAADHYICCECYICVKIILTSTTRTFNNKQMKNIKSTIDDLYSVMVESLRVCESEKIFENQDSVYANIVLTNIFKAAQSNINMLTGKMDMSVMDSPELTQALDEFLSKKGANMSIVLTEEPTSQDGTILDSIKKRDNVSVYQAPQNIHERYDPEKENFHFTVADDRAFRFEHDTENYKALCSFNSKEKCKKLNDIFTDMIKNSTPIPIESKKTIG